MPIRVLLCRALVLWLLAGCASAQVFWAVADDHGRHNWLLGTLHSSDPRVLELAPVVEQAVLQAETVMLELVPGRAERAALEAAMRLPADTVLAEQVPPDLYARMVAALCEQGIAQEQIERMQPWAAALALVQPTPSAGGFMDLRLAELARTSGADVQALETPAEQIAVFQTLAKETIQALLEQALAAFPDRKAAHARLVTAWLAGDLDVLNSLALADLDALPQAARAAFIEQGLTSRNAVMAERARPCLVAGHCLVAVGALHLAGEHGLVARLRRAGWRVEPIF
ncbi:MAG: TraB/GumN family protein [Wenzhouxiangellaceae bacterium]|nr:TraB/GumN family protein [Wenzhouxiangellaceae bacterium]